MQYAMKIRNSPNRRSLHTQRRIFFLMLGVLMFACTTLTVTNETDREMRVQVSMPDGEGPVVKKVAPHDAVEFLSDTGGNFDVNVMVSEDYLIELRQQADAISLMLFDPRQEYSQTQMSNIVNLLNRLHNKIETLMSHSDGCIAYVEQDEAGEARISWLHEPSTLPTVQCNTE